jgi:hypothetical protein
MIRSAGAVNRMARVNGPRIAIAIYGAARRLIRRLLQRLEFALSQIVLSFLPCPFPPFTLENLPVGLETTELIEDGVRILVSRPTRGGKGRHVELLHMLHVRRWWTIAEMHPALAVDPAKQGTRVGLGRMADGKQGCQAKLPETVAGKRPVRWID